MGVRAAARLHCCYLLWIPDVGYVENSYTAKPILLRRGYSWFLLFAGGRRRLRWKSLRAAIETAVGHLDRHEHQVLVNRNVSLSARTNHRRYQLRLGGIGYVVDID